MQLMVRGEIVAMPLKVIDFAAEQIGSNVKCPRSRPTSSVRRWSGLRAPPNPMVALARRIGWGLAIVVGLLIATTILTARTGDPALWPPAAGSPTVEILVVSHGYHSGLALPRALVADVAERHGRSALIAVAQRFAAYPWIEVGWGDGHPISAFMSTTP